MFKAIFVNKGLKVFSILTAFLVWFHVITEKTYEKLVKIPVTWVNLQKDFFLAKPPPDEVQVRLSGPGKEFLWLDKSLKVVIDLRSQGMGWHRIDLNDESINMSNGSRLTLKEGPYPSSFVIRIDKQAQKQVRIIPNLKTNYIFEIIPPATRIKGGSGDIFPVSAILTDPIIPKDSFPETLKVKLVIPEGIQSDADSVTVILKAKL